MHVLSFGEGRFLFFVLAAWKFPCDHLTYFAPARRHSRIRLIGDSIVFFSEWQQVEVWWVSGLGIGFWLRGVQPRTTVR